MGPASTCFSRAAHWNAPAVKTLPHLRVAERNRMGLIEDSRQGLVPLIVPPTLLKHHLNRYSVPEWVHQQVYLHPYPKELKLRNHV